jgi:type IV pilus assembly protein PilC
MLFFLLPTFGSMFSTMKTDLPPLTAWLLSVSEFAISNIHLIILVLLALVVTSHFLARSKSFKEGFIDPVMLRVPFLSSLFRQNLLARFSLSMSILLKSNVNLLESLRISKNISANSLFREEIGRITKKLIKGESLANNIRRSEFFDITFNKLLAAGEESAELDKVFYLISEYYSREFDYRIDSITGMIEPVLILLIGTIVAVILIAMYLPMFEIINYLGV